MKPCTPYLLLSLIIFAATISCKKGDTGPPGTANVVYSEWFKPSTYTKETVFGTIGFYHNQPAPGITQEILDKGTVLVYAKLEGYTSSVWPVGQVGQLPVTVSYVQGAAQQDTWIAYASPGNLQIRFTNDHNLYTSIATAHQFRYVIIPGGKSGNVAVSMP